MSKVYFIGEEKRHKYDAAVLVHKCMMSAILGYRLVSSGTTGNLSLLEIP